MVLKKCTIIIVVVLRIFSHYRTRVVVGVLVENMLWNCLFGVAMDLLLHLRIFK